MQENTPPPPPQNSAEPPPAASRRRVFLGLGALIVGSIGLRTWLSRRAEEKLSFIPLKALKGFRLLEGSGGQSGTSGVQGVLLGIDNEISERQTALNIRALSRAELCTALFGPEVMADVAEKPLPIAFFTDYYCPYCRLLMQRLDELRSEYDFRMTWHELPLLSPYSELASRAVLAAQMQGDDRAFRAALEKSSFLPTRAFIMQTARSIGLDAPRLWEEMNSPEVDRRLETSNVLASAFGFIGTPAMVVGQTVVLGAISKPTLAALLAQENKDGGAGFCTSGT